MIMIDGGYHDMTSVGFSSIKFLLSTALQNGF